MGCRRHRGQPVVKAVIYIEGGGVGRRLRGQFRTAWGSFFESAGLNRPLPAVMRGGSRNDTFAQFAEAVKNAPPGELPILLVDSEGPVAPGHSVWQHLHQQDGWQQPAGASAEQAFLMVQAMETWLLADPDALRNYFGRSFRAGRLPQRPDLESIPKDDALRSLENATADCRRPYAKGTVSFDILARINANLVAAKCPYAKSLLDYLRSL